MLSAAAREFGWLIKDVDLNGLTTDKKSIGFSGY